MKAPGWESLQEFLQPPILPPPSASTHNFPCQGRKEEHITQFNNLYKLKSLLCEGKGT